MSALWRAGLYACPETEAVIKGARDGGRTPCDDGALAAGPGASWYAALPCGILDGVGRTDEEYRLHGCPHADGEGGATGLEGCGPLGL